jgi:hypothetical protein
MSACANLKNDSANCGSCGVKCNPGQVCSGGKCVQYLHASGCWECGLGNIYTHCCASAYNAYTICLNPTEAAGDAGILCP